MINAEEMLFDLQAYELEVVLVPAPDPRHSGHKIRVAQNQNARWYQEFCAQYRSNRRGRKWRTRIKRRETIRALENILDGKTEGLYVERLLEFIRRKNENEKFRALARPVEYAEYEPMAF
jgi:hypothetical protein